MSTPALRSSKPTRNTLKSEPELPASSSRRGGSSPKPTKSSQKRTFKPATTPPPPEPPFPSLPSSISELTEILTHLGHLPTPPPTVSAATTPHTAPPAPAVPAHHPYHFPTTLGPHLHEQTYILSALTALLQLLYNQRWTPATAATNLASLQRKRSTVSTLMVLPPEPKGGDAMAMLKYATLKRQKEAWEAMTVAQRECEYEELLGRVDAARARTRVGVGAGERMGARVGEEVLRVFDAQFDEAVEVLVERWGVWGTKGLGDDMVMLKLYGGLF